MTKYDETNGWGLVPAAKEWKCPRCSVISPVEDWKEVWPYCDCCGDHEGRECPNCEEWFDYIWDEEELRDAQKDL